MEEEIEYEQEEYMTIYRKTKRKHGKSRNSPKDANRQTVSTEFQLSPLVHGAKTTQPVRKEPDNVHPTANNYVHRLVKNTLSELDSARFMQGVEKNSECGTRLFLGECDFDEEEDKGKESADKNVTRTHGVRQGEVWRFNKTGKKGLDRFRRIVEFIIIAKQIFTVRRPVRLNRRDSIMFFLDTQMEPTNPQGTPLFDVTAFKSLGQKTMTSSMKSCLDVPPASRTDVQINHLVHAMRGFTKFAGYPQAVQTGICRRGWYARFESTTVIVREGNRAEFYYIILSGLAVSRNAEVTDEFSELDNQDKQSAKFLTPGDMIGEREILTDQDRPATIVCKQAVEVLGVDRDILLDIFKAAGGMTTINYLRTIPELAVFPLELLQTSHFSMSVHHYRRGAVIVRNSNDSEWVYVVRSGSCQVYKAIREERHLDSARQSPCTKLKQREEGSLVLPAIQKTKNMLKSASTDDLAGIARKQKQSKDPPGLERSQTSFPILNPGKTSLTSNTAMPKERLKTPTISKIKRRGKKDKHKSPRSSLVDTPQRRHNSDKASDRSLTPPQRGRESQDSLSRASREKGSLSECSETAGKSSPLPETAGRLLKKHSDSSNSDSSPFFEGTGGPLFYVRLNMLFEKGCFGIHPLLYDHMPSVSLVSNGAECILISKQFLAEHLDRNLVYRLQMTVPPYPSKTQLHSALDQQLLWETYREKVVSDVLK